MITIPIKEGSPFPLREARVGRLNAFRARLVGIPDDVENVQIAFSGASGADNVVPATPASGNEWSVYASPLLFPVAGEMKYHVTARTAQGNSLWLGAGKFRVEESAVNTDAANAPIIPDDTYLRNPATGKWHRLTVSFEDGLMVPEIDPNGVAR